MASVSVMKRVPRLPAAPVPKVQVQVQVAPLTEQSESKPDLTIIARAFAYHKVLSKKGMDIDFVYTDSENGYEEFGSDDSSLSGLGSDEDDEELDSDDDDDDDDDENEDEDDNEKKSDGSEAADSDEDEDIEQHLVKVTMSNPLILPPPRSKQVPGM